MSESLLEVQEQSLPLFCDLCINSKLAELKRQKEQSEKEARLREEQAFLEHSRRMAQLELENFTETRKNARMEAQKFSNELESKFLEKKRRPDYHAEPTSSSNFLKEVEESRLKYREELMGQIKYKQDQKSQLEREEREEERKRLEEIESEKERSRRELEAESRMQKEAYRFTLSQQMNHKRSQRDEEAYQKKVEKALLDEEVRKFQLEQRILISRMKGSSRASEGGSERGECSGYLDDSHISTCTSCKKILPLQTLSKFPS